MSDTTTEPRTIKSDVEALIDNHDELLSPPGETAEKLVAYFGLIEKRTVSTFTIPLLAQGIQTALNKPAAEGVSALDLATSAYDSLHGNGFSVCHSDRLDQNNVQVFLGTVLAMDPQSMTVRVLAEAFIAFMTEEVQ